MTRIPSPPAHAAARRAQPAMGIVLAACGDPCDNTERARTPSPDGRHEVVVFGRACMRSAASAHVSVVAPGARAVGVGNVFAAERDLPLEARWTGPAALHVRYPRQGEVGTRPELDGVRITFDSSASPPAAPVPSP
ncbi:MAG: hypothetical protein ACXW0Z_06950 [Gemmatirosa sp.]